MVCLGFEPGAAGCIGGDKTTKLRRLSYFNSHNLSQRLKYVPAGVDLLRLKIPFLNKKGDGRLVYTFNMDDVLEVRDKLGPST